MPNWGYNGVGGGGYDPGVHAGQTPVKDSSRGIDRWVWPDGSPLNDSELSANGLHDFDLGQTASDALHAAGTLPSQAGPGTPGSDVNTSQVDIQRQNMESLVAALQQQAATGGGAWEKALQSATDQASAAASSLSQSDPSQGFLSSAMNQGSAQAAAQQRAVGQGNILRARSQLSAQDQLGSLLGSMGTSDIEQANAQARARQQVAATNLDLIDKAQATSGNMLNLGGQGASKLAALSHGGRVPGQPAVFGDDSKNDTVPAMLSPQEIVVPISAAHDPNKAAAFARAVAMHKGAKGYAGGGGIGTASLDEYGSGNTAASIFLPHIGTAAGYGHLRDLATGPPSTQNGGLLDTAQFDQTRANRGMLDSMLAQRAAGNGPSVGPQELQDSGDSAIAQALAARSRGAPASRVVSGGALAAQEGGASVAETIARQQAEGQRALAGVGTQARAQELSLAEAQQQAGWENTMQRLGVSLSDQAALRNAFAGAGQAMTAASGSRSDPERPTGGGGSDEGFGPDSGPEGVSPGAGDSDTGATDAGGGDDGGGAGDGLAHGGRVMSPEEHERSARFIKALHRKRAA